MGLTVTVAVNEKPVAFLAVLRTSGRDVADQSPLDVNTYEVRLFDVAEGNVKQVGDAVKVDHMYGDGARHLAHLALEASLRQR